MMFLIRMINFLKQISENGKTIGLNLGRWKKTSMFLIAFGMH